MKVRELREWIDHAESVLADDVGEMECEFQLLDARLSDMPILVPVDGASVQGDKVQLY